MNRLQQVISRQIDDEETAQVLWQQLAYENATAECQATLFGIRTQARGIAEFIRACQNVGTETHDTQTLVAIMRPSPASHACCNVENQGTCKGLSPTNKGTNQEVTQEGLCQM